MSDIRTNWVHLDKETLVINADIWATACIDDSDILIKLERALHTVLSSQDSKDSAICQRIKQVHESIIKSVEQYQATQSISKVNLAQEQDHE
ncbi:MAG: hypothetical protein Q4P13_12860 [Psychrobacter sp.]|nr:hypothetical protein [Psychrobacter sp.]